MSAQVMERDGFPVGDRYAVGGAALSEGVESWVWRGKPHRTPAPARDTARGVDWHRWTRNAMLVVPLLLVNGFAAYGQALWAHDHLPGGWRVAALFAAAVESIALYLSAEAHAALMAGDAALARRASSYAVAGLVGFLNWLHWSGPGGSPTVLAAVFAGFSVVSPWLWAVRSRSMRRDVLRAAGLVDPRAVRFASAKWVMFPVRTFRSLRAAVGEGVQDPREAWSLTAPAAPAVPVAVPVAVEVAASAPSAPPAPSVAPQIAVPGPGVPPSSKAPARPTRKPRASGPRSATDEDVLRVAGRVLDANPAAGRTAVADALESAGFRPGDKVRLARLIAQAKADRS